MLRWFRSSKPRGLPQPSGPFTVGFVDYEWQPQNTEYSDQAPPYVLTRIYYPSLPVMRTENPDEMKQQWRSRYGYYLKMPWYIASPIFRLVVGNTPIWAIENAPVASVDQLSTMPLVIFSHGLAGIRTTYSTICTDLASHGYIVASMEHRDGSASMSVIPQDETVLHYRHPPTDNEEAHQFRSLQLRHRRQEISSTLDLLFDKENTAENVWKTIEGKGALGREDISANPILILKDRLDKDRVIMAGHSFGAATSIFSAQEDDRINAVLALDPWLYPLPHDFIEHVFKRGVPMVSINTETFHWPGNMETLKAVLERNHQCGGNPSMQITILNSGHMDQSDFSVLIPPWLLRRYRSSGLGDPEKLLQINARLTRAFVDGAAGRRADPPDSFGMLIWNKQRGLDGEEIRIDIQY